MGERVNVEITRENAVAVVAFKDASMSSDEVITAASQKINEFIEENHPATIVVDFESVKFFSSQVLGMLLAIRDKVKACNGEVVISAINPQLYRVFKITNLNKIFRFFPDRKSAITALNVS